MNELFKLILKMSISGSIFFIVFYILTFFTQKVFCAKWHFKLMKINMIFYIVPIVLIYDFFTRNFKSTVNLNSVNLVFNKIGTSNYSIQMTKYLFIIWIIGVSVISFWKIYCYKRFIKEIKLSSYRDEELEKNVCYCKKMMNINSIIKVRRSHITASPMIIGIFNPTIIFPKNIECSYKLEPVINHELIHYKRKDLLFNMIQLCIVTMNWFNPIVYVINNIFEKWCEISCDEIVAENMSYSKRKEYGETILNIIEGRSIASNNVCFYLCNSEKYMKRRLMMMLNIKKESKFKKALSVIFVSAIFVFSAGVSVTATTNNTNFINDENSISTINKNGVSIKIEANDEGIKKLLEERIEEMINYNGPVRGAITVVDPKGDEVIGSASFSRE